MYFINESGEFEYIDFELSVGRELDDLARIDMILKQGILEKRTKEYPNPPIAWTYKSVPPDYLKKNPSVRRFVDDIMKSYE